jgi:hypothetical protein
MGTSYLYSDGQQFHQYQQNKVTSHLKSLNTKRPWHDIGNPDPDFGQAQKCGRGLYHHYFFTFRHSYLKLLSSSTNLKCYKLYIHSLHLWDVPELGKEKKKHAYCIFSFLSRLFLCVRCTWWRFMNRKFRQWWSTIPPISTKQSYLSPQIIEHKKTMTWHWKSRYGRIYSALSDFIIGFIAAYLSFLSLVRTNQNR